MCCISLRVSIPLKPTTRYRFMTSSSGMILRQFDGSGQYSRTIIALMLGVLLSKSSAAMP